MKYYAVILFFKQNKPNQEDRYKPKVHLFNNNYHAALDLCSTIPYPDSLLLEAKNDLELRQAIDQTLQRYQSP